MKNMTDAERTQWRSDNWPLDRTATDYLCVWLVNDQGPYNIALGILEEEDDAGTAVAALAENMSHILDYAVPGSGAWHTRRGLSDNDMGRIDWLDIAETLLAE